MWTLALKFANVNLMAARYVYLHTSWLKVLSAVLSNIGAGFLILPLTITQAEVGSRSLTVVSPRLGNR